MRRLLLALLFGAILMLAGCQESDPADAVEAYLQALVAGDAGRLQTLACAAWEAQAVTQAQSFQAAAAELKDMDCRRTGGSGDSAQVACSGEIVAAYNGERRRFPLGTYLVAREGGEWRFCGEGD